MINKEEIENLIEEMTKLRPDQLSEEGQKLFNTVMQIIDERDRLEEINEEHQKLNGELQQRITELEEICKGKSIQELGVSKLYESNELREQIEEAKKRGWNDITVEVDKIDRILG